MVRLTGILALLASAALAAVLFGRVQAYHGSGILTCTVGGDITVCLRDSIELAPEFEDWPPTRHLEHPTHVWEMKFPGSGREVGLRGATRVDVELRLLALRWPTPILEGSLVRDDAHHAYPCTRPLLRFYGILALVATAPVLLWSFAALVALGVKRGR